MTCVALADVRPAFSQGAAPRSPAGGLFGATRTDVGGSDRLNFTFELAESLDSELPADAASQLTRGLESGGLSTLLQAGSDYTHNGRRLRLLGNASTAFRYSQNLDRVDPISHNAFLSANLRFGNGTVRLEQAAAYSPQYLYQLFPTDTSAPLGGAIPSNPEYQIEETESYTYRTRAALSFGSQQGTFLTTTGSFDRTDFRQETLGREDSEIAQAGVEMSHRFAPSRAVSVGYDYRAGESGFVGRTEEHRLTLGAEYAPALSRTRRATFSLRLTPERVFLPAAAFDITSENPANLRLMRLSGEAAVRYPFRPNWRTEARYRRSVEYLSVLGQPVLSDAGRFEVGGLLARPLDVGFSGGYATAVSALDRSGRTLQTYTGQVTIRYALKRSLALYSEYSYYYFDLRGQAALAALLPGVFEQHGVRLGATVFLETLGR